MALALATPLSEYFEAQNAHDLDAMLSVFADHASVRDEGEDITGRAAIRAWIEETTLKYRVAVIPAGVSLADGRTIVTAQVSGTFPGSPIKLNYRFTIVDEKISNLEIN